MLAYEPIYKKIASSLEHNGTTNLQDAAQKYDAARCVSPIVAHELNNILTVVQGYADRLLMQPVEDESFVSHLKLISEAAKRAAAIVRAATPPNANDTFRPASQTQAQQAA